MKTMGPAWGPLRSVALNTVILLSRADDRDSGSLSKGSVDMIISLAVPAVHARRSITRLMISSGAIICVPQGQFHGMRASAAQGKKERGAPGSA